MIKRKDLNRIAVVVCVIILLSCVLVSCGNKANNNTSPSSSISNNQSKPPEVTTDEVSLKGISMQIPTAWAKVSTTDTQLTYYISDDSSVFMASVTDSSKNKLDKDTEDDLITKVYGDGFTLIESKLGEVAGIPAYEAKFSANLNGVESNGIQYVFYYNFKHYLLIFSEKKEDDSMKHVAEIATVVSSIKTTEPATSIKEITVGETITTDTKEIKINNIEFTYDVLPDDTSGYYNHYPADSGKVYIQVDTDVKNLQKQQLKCTDIALVTVDYNDGFEYKGQAVPEDSTLGFTYANITSIDPLESLGVRFLVNCPEEVESSENPVIVFIHINEDIYQYKLK